MRVTADCDGTNRFFYAKLGFREHFDPKELEILTSGILPRLIRPSAVMGKGNNKIRFDISAYSTLEFYLTCILSREQLADLLLQCIDVFRRLQAVYLNYSNLVLELDKIYILLENHTLYFVYLPLMNSKRKASMPLFFKQILHKASRSTYEQSSFLDACLAWLERPFLLEEFDAFIRKHIDLPASGSENFQINQGQPHGYQQRTPIYISPTPSSVSPSTADATVSISAMPEEGTIRIASTSRFSSSQYFLISKTGEKIEINASPFLVGQDKGRVTYCVLGNPVVSRVHAEFLIYEGYCTIMDKSSTNGTFVNRQRLNALVEQRLEDGDEILLGDERFIFTREEQHTAATLN